MDIQNNDLKIKVVLGSTRQGRFGEKPANWIFEKAKAKGFDVELLDLRDYPMPFFEEAETPSYKKAPYANSVVAQWTAKVAEADGFIFVTPEYNHGYSAVLKNAIDYVGAEWTRKPVSFVGYGSLGGGRSVEQLREVVSEREMAPLRNAVHLVNPWNSFGADGKLDTAQWESAADSMLDQLAWWTKALKAARTV